LKIYTQLSYEERLIIGKMKLDGDSVTQIAHHLCRSKSTISRELKRNQAPPGQYWPDTAQNLVAGRRERLSRIDKDSALRELILDKLMCHYWTPEQISGYLKWRQNEIKPISHESIYAWIYHPNQKKDKLWKFLYRHKSKRGLRKYQGAGASRIPNRVSIHERPKAIDNKKQFGHWEGDLMSFCKNSQHILVLRERKSMFTISSPLPNKTALATARQLIDCMNKLPQKARRSLTLDNGGEFSAHGKYLEQLGLKSFFCDPYASWQKGGVENTNGRLRRDLPRKTDVKQMPKEEFDEVILNYNTTPRKNLNWQTPKEVFDKYLHRVAL